MSEKRADLVARGSKEPSPVGSTVFVGLRGLEPVFQYAILRNQVGSSLFDFFGTHATPIAPHSNYGISFIDNLGLSPYRTVLLSMSIAAALKQNIWQVALAGEPMPVAAAVPVGLLNWLFNSINDLLFTCAATSIATGRGESPHSGDWPALELTVGASLFAVGITTELVSEVQRGLFKRDPKNKGLVYTGGLFGLSRHVNYFGYTLWRTGYAIAGGGWIWGAATAALFAFDFNTRAIPVLDSYCSQRYADLWKIYKEKTPYQFVPYLY